MHRSSLLVVAALVAAACGSSSGTATTEATQPSTAATTTTQVATTTAPSTTTSAATTTTSQPTTTTTVVEAFASPYSFGDQHPESPVITPGEWDAAFTAVPHVILQEDGTWLMFYSGDPGRRDPSSMGLATSTDGITWEKHPDNPIFTHQASSQGVGWLYVIDDGDQWRMLYTLDFGVGYRDVYAATAPAPEGPWTETGQAFVAPGTDCCKRILPGGLVEIDGTFWVPFAGFESGRANPSIGFLTSTDFVEWTATEVPVYGGTGEGWDQFGVMPANIVVTDAGLELFFLGFERDPAINTSPDFSTFKMGRLVSTDGGATWAVDNDGQPVVDTGERGWPGVTTVYVDGTYYFYLGDDLGSSGIALITGTIP